MAATISNVGRRRTLADLHPLEISQDLTSDLESSASRSSSVIFTNTSSLPSPGLLAARAWYLESPIRQDLNALQRRRTLIEAQAFPRRHSTMPTPDSTVTKSVAFKLPSPKQNIEAVREDAELDPKANPHNTEDVHVMEVKQNDIVKLTTVATGIDPASPSVAGFLARVPFDYTHARLRDWGYAYLGQVGTADAFINPVSFRRPSLVPEHEDNTGSPSTSTRKIIIRARVHPKAKERKPFLIQRQFDVEELRASTPSIRRPIEKTSTPLRRSSRTRRFSTQQLPNKSPRRDSHGKMSANLTSLGKGPVPIHIEYALHFLPVLAALLLSGHVRRGDLVDLPVPCPEAWRAMTTYIYTGRGDVTASVKENILYLAGNAE